MATLLAPKGRWSWIALPAAHTIVEAIRFSFPFGGVPLASLAIAQSGGPLLPIVRVGGAVLLTWVTLQLGAALGALGRAEVRRVGSAALAVCAVLLALAYVAPSGRSEGRSISVAFVQGGGPQGTRAIHSDPSLVVQRHLEATALLEPGPDLVVWPENAIDVDVFEGSTVQRAIAAEAERLDATFLVGVTEDTADGSSFVNAQVVVNTDGSVGDRYVKVRRVPFGEYMPFRGFLDSIGAPVDLVPRDALAGDGDAYVDTPVARVAVAISWEVFFGGRGRDGVVKGGELLVNPTNGSSYTGTILQTQQVASSRLRAVENGRWVVQVAPTGFSAFVTPSGEVLQRTSISAQAVRTQLVELRAGRTIYHRLGELPIVFLAALVMLVASLVSPRASRYPHRK
ncbi:MAG: apolipoprotein N-acyltransferase [Ilumatobacteraceae bacterium]